MSKFSKRKWRILCWNVRGINADNRQRQVRSKIEEGECDIICLQETKCEQFDWRAIRKFCPKRFDCFACAPSVGASGGILVLWNSAIFSGLLVQTEKYGIIINFTCMHNNEAWTIVCVYGPCQGVQRDNFVTWLYNLQIPSEENWLFLGDFNFMCSQDNRNKPGGDISDIFC
jgi:exonuclease III